MKSYLRIRNGSGLDVRFKTGPLHLKTLKCCDQTSSWASWALADIELVQPDPG